MAIGMKERTVEVWPNQTAPEPPSLLSTSLSSLSHHPGSPTSKCRKMKPRYF